MAASFLTVIPLELTVEVLSCLDPSSLCRCRQVCRAFQSLVDKTASLQYKIELYATGTQSSTVSSRDPTARSCLERLKAFQQNWDQLKFQTRHTLRMQRGGIWELYGGVLAQNNKKKEFFFYRLPSKTRGIEEKSWIMEPADFPVRDFGMDPAQDLLVLIESPRWSRVHGEMTHVLHLLSLENKPGEAHPLATDGKVLQHVQRFRDADTSYAIQISGDYIGLLINTVHDGQNEFIVWDWKKGEVMLDIEGDRIRAFSFLSDEHVVLCSLLLPEDRDEGEHDSIKPSLAVVNFRAEDKSKRSVTALESVVSFRFPPLQETATMITFEIRSDPAPTWEPRHDVSVPFHLAKYNRIYVVSVWIHDSRGIQCILLFVPMNTFLSHLGSGTDSQREGKIREWDTWGPAGTRLLVLPRPHSDVWVCYVHGTRYIALEALTSPHDSLSCRVYDFNPIGIRRALTNAEIGQIVTEEGVGEQIKTSTKPIYQLAPTVIPQGAIFEQEVRTSLPFRWISMPLGVARRKRYAAMCTEDNLIVVDTMNHEYLMYSF